MNLDSANEKFICKFFNPKTKKYISLIAKQSPSGHGNTAYCQINDPNFPIIDNQITYQFSLEFLTLNISGNYLNKLGLYTSSDISEGKIILDANYFFNQMALFDDYSKMSNPYLKITEAKLNTQNLVLDMSFDLTVTFKVEKFIAKNSLILFKFPSKYLYEPYTCYSEKVEENDILKSLLKGNINCRLFNNEQNTLILTGLDEDLIQDRNFKIVFRGFKTKESQNANLAEDSKLFEALVLYPNSYSVLSYSKNPIFSIKNIKINSFKIKNKENNNIYSGASWPLNFSFSIEQEIKKPIFIAIQQSNQSDLNKINLIASTCDFSANQGLISNNFGERPKCIPLSLDSNNYSQKGEGIFFFMENILANKVYNLNIFAYAEKCGNSVIAKTGLPGISEIQPKYKLSIFSQDSLDISKFNENRIFNTNNKLIGETEETSMANLCLNSLQMNYEIANVAENKDTINADIIYDVSGGNEKIILNQIHDFKFGIYNDVKKCEKDSTCYFNDLKTTSNKFNEGYLYSKQDNKLLNNSFFSLRSSIPYPQGPKLNPILSRHMFATNIFRETPATKNPSVFGNSSMNFIINSNYLEKGDSQCSLWWGYRHEFIDITKNPFDYNNKPVNPVNSKQFLMSTFNNPDADFKNWITTKGSVPNIDKDKTIFNENEIVISSVQYKDEIKVFQREDEPECERESAPSNKLKCNLLNFSIFSNCLKFKTEIPPPKSQFNYIDFSVRFRNEVLKVDSRVNRFFKFVYNNNLMDPILGSSQYSIFNTFSTSDIKFYLAGINSENTDNGICLISIDKDALKALATDDSNTFRINFQGLTLFETDYTDLASNYPIYLGNDEYRNAISHNSKNFVSNFNEKIKTKEIFIDKDNMAMVNQFQETYYMALGSMIIFHDLNKNKINENLTIPTFCPKAKEKISASFSWEKSYINNYIGDIEKFTSIAYYEETCSVGKCSKRQRTYFESTSKDDGDLISTAKIYFKPFTKVDVAKYENSDLLFRNVFSGGNLNMQAMSLLLAPEIKVFEQNLSNEASNSQKITINYGSGILNTVLVKSLNNFYAFGQKFDKFLFHINSSNVQILKITGNLDGTKDFYIRGIYRPTLDSYVENPLTNLVEKNNKIALFGICTSDYLSNISFNYEVGFSNANSIPISNNLDLNFPIDNTVWPTYECSKDNLYPNYKDDNGGSMICDIKTPMKISPSTKINLSVSAINENSVCSLKSVNSNNHLNSQVCGFNSVGLETYSKSIFCNVIYPDDTFRIACYNLKISEYSINFDNNKITLNDKDKTPIFEKPSDPYVKKITATNDLFDITKTPSLKAPDSPIEISEIKYEYSNQENGIGKAIFSVNFPRKILRNSELFLYIDLSKFIIPSMNKLPNCRIMNSITNKNNSPEALLRKCEIFKTTKEDQFSGKIIFTFKSPNYFQNLDLGKSLQFIIFPVFTPLIDIDNNKITNKFKYSYVENNGEILSTTAKIAKFNKENYFTNFSAFFQRKNLCDITKAFPGVENSNNRITITIDLQSSYYKNINKNKKDYPINEILIYFPAMYMDFPDEIDCISNANFLMPKNLKCFKIEDEELPEYIIMKIKFSDDTYLPSGFFEINVNNIKFITPKNIGAFKADNRNQAKQISSVDTFSFPCSYTNYNENSAKRVILTNGFGELKYKVYNPKTYGTLNLNSLISSNYIARKSAILTMRLSFELIGGLTSRPNILDENPLFSITFPPEMITKYTRNMNIECSLADLKGGNSQLALKEELNSLKSCEFISSNTLIMELNSSMKNITDPNFQMFQIKLNGTFNPPEEIYSTSTFDVYLTSKTGKYLYRTFSNLNFQTGDNKKLTYISNSSYNFMDKYINYYRGFSYIFDSNTWNVDIYETQKDIIKDQSFFNFRNKINIKSGRFTSITLRIRENKSIPNAESSFEIGDNIFSFYNPDSDSKNNNTPPKFQTALNSLQVYIGTSCTTIPGNYHTHIKFLNIKNFNPVVPLDIIVSKTKALIDIDIPKINIVKGSKVKLPIFIPEPNFDLLDINFFPDKTNDPSAKINKIQLKPFTKTSETEFSSGFSAKVLKQKFNPQILNNCYSIVPQKKTFEINLDTTAGILKKDFDLKNYFTIDDPNYDSSIKPNGFKFIFSPPVNYGFIACLPVCFNADYPTQDIIMSNSFSSLYGKPVSKTFSSKNPEPHELHFTNLIRGERYRIKCLFQFAEQTSTLSKSAEIQKLPIVRSSLDVNKKYEERFIETKKNSETKCIQFYFENKIEKLIQTSFVDFCQLLFNDINGCPICVDSLGNVNESYVFSKKRNCGYKGDNNYLNNTRENPNNLNIDQKNEKENNPLYMSRKYEGNVNNLKYPKSIDINGKLVPLYIPKNYGYLLCVVQDKMCNNDMPEKLKDDKMNNLILSLNSNDKIKETLGLNNPGYINSYLINDEKPDLSNIGDFIIIKPSINTEPEPNKKIFIQMYYEKPLLCYWKVQLQEKNKPDQFEIQNCYDNDICGSIKINMIPQDVMLANKKKIEEDKIYTIYFFCYNDLPYPTNYSDVVIISSFKNLQ